MDTWTAVDRLLRPRSVAIVGASSDEDSMGGAPLINLVEHGYDGGVFLVNPRRESVGGRRCYSSIQDLPGPVDTAIVVAPTAAVYDIIPQLAGVTSTATVVAAGFHAIPGENRDLTKIAADSGIRILGPNTTGVLNLNDGYCPRAARNHSTNLKSGPVALVAQSGGVGNTVFNRAQALGMGIGLFVGTGDSIDITPWNVAGYALAKSDIDTILLVIEGALPASELHALSEAALARNVDLLLYKMARTDSGQRTAITHTGSISEPSHIAIATARKLGFTVVDDIDELWQVGWTLGARRSEKRARGTKGDTSRINTAKIGIITLSGGLGVAAADLAEEMTFLLPEPDADLSGRIAAEVGLDATEVGNPFDPGSAPMRDPEGCAKACRTFIDGMDVDETVLLVPVMQERVAERVLSRLIPGLAGCEGNLLICAYRAGPGTDRSIELLQEIGVPVVDGVGSALRTIATTVESERLQSTRLGLKPQRSSSTARERRQGNAKSYWESRIVLGHSNVPMVEGRLLECVEEGLRALEEWGPVVLKGSVGGQPHKAAAGLVALNIGTPSRLKFEFDRLRTIASGLDGYDGIVCEPLVPDGIDFLVGGSFDVEYGPFLTIGTGGRYAETADDATVLPLPLSPALVEQAVDSTIAGRTLNRSMTSAGSLKSTLISAIGSLAELLADERIGEFDLNPIRCLDTGVIALDALVVG